MDNALYPLLELSREPVLAVEGGKIAMMNGAAQQAFPSLRIGDLTAGLIPDAILSERADFFAGAAAVAGVSCAVTAVRHSGLLFLSLQPERWEIAAPVSLSDGQISGILSAMFNIGMSADRLRCSLEQENADTRKYLGTLQHNYYILLRRLGSLNALRGLRSGSMELVYRHVDLTSLCADIVSSVNVLTGGAFAPVEFICEAPEVPACLDAPKVEQLILHLIANSLLHTPKEGHVRLKLSCSESRALIAVSDTGSGIPPRLLSGIFGERHASETPEDLAAEPGGGVGLALCRAIAEKHGGTLILESRVGAGTDVRVLFPLSPPDSIFLRSEEAEYGNGGMEIMLTELSELLSSKVYEEFLSGKQED